MFRWPPPRGKRQVLQHVPQQSALSYTGHATCRLSPPVSRLDTCTQSAPRLGRRARPRRGRRMDAREGHSSFKVESAERRPKKASSGDLSSVLVVSVKSNSDQPVPQAPALVASLPSAFYHRFNNNSVAVYQAVARRRCEGGGQKGRARRFEPPHCSIKGLKWITGCTDPGAKPDPTRGSRTHGRRARRQRRRGLRRDPEAVPPPPVSRCRKRRRPPPTGVTHIVTGTAKLRGVASRAPPHPGKSRRREFMSGSRNRPAS
ncbi:unnamed protein product [Lampetra planeri]